MPTPLPDWAKVGAHIVTAAPLNDIFGNLSTRPQQTYGPDRLTGTIRGVLENGYDHPPNNGRLWIQYDLPDGTKKRWYTAPHLVRPIGQQNAIRIRIQHRAKHGSLETEECIPWY